jgi:hypothetical protein
MGGVPFLLADVCVKTGKTNPLFLWSAENEPIFPPQLASRAGFVGLGREPVRAYSKKIRALLLSRARQKAVFPNWATSLSAADRLTLVG